MSVTVSLNELISVVKTCIVIISDRAQSRGEFKGGISPTFDSLLHEFK